MKNKKRVRLPFLHAVRLKGKWSGTIVFLAILSLIIGLFVAPMGVANCLNTLMNTAYQLLIDTVLYLVAITVISGAFSALLMEFGVTELLNRLLSPLMKPFYGMPGAAALGIVSTYLSDNPAILTLVSNEKYRRYFEPYQLPALTNMGTAFGMGLVVTAFTLGQGNRVEGEIWTAVLCGNLGAIAGSILSTRLMLKHTKKTIADGSPMNIQQEEEITLEKGEMKTEKVSADLRLLTAVLAGGKDGLVLGIRIIPGVLIICTFVAMLTFGPSANGSYTGAAFEGIALFTRLAPRLGFLLEPLFGFSNALCITVPITALGSAGAALGMIPELITRGIVGCNEMAVFTAMCMCWSGYLSTHVAMMDAMQFGRFTKKAILFHTFSGIFAGCVAHWLYLLFSTVTL